VLSPTAILTGYLTVQQQIPIAVHAEPLSHPRDIECAKGQMSTAKAINKAHEDSGLTWEQLGRVFGVSRRAVHMWASGGRVNATNAELLMRFVDLLGQIEGGPDERRAALLAVGSDGKSAIDKFRSAYTNIDHRFSGLPRPEELLGALHGDGTRDDLDVSTDMPL
jgi:DNA-binding transcriptional regulator YiaG